MRVSLSSVLLPLLGLQLASSHSIPIVESRAEVEKTKGVKKYDIPDGLVASAAFKIKIHPPGGKWHDASTTHGRRLFKPTPMASCGANRTIDVITFQNLTNNGMAINYKIKKPGCYHTTENVPMYIGPHVYNVTIQP